MTVEQATSTCRDEQLRSVLRGLLTTIGDKWTLAVVATLLDGELRFTAIQQQVEGISHRMLTKTLRDLERDGLVFRQAYAEMPPRVQYGLTPLGRTLLDPIEGLSRWVDQHGRTVLEHRAQHPR